MLIDSADALTSHLTARTDSDGLVSGAFDEIEQDWVRVGQFWIGLDPRIPWQLAACVRKYSQLLGGLRLRLNLSAIEPTKAHRSPLRKAFWWGARFRWEQLESYGAPIRTVHADPADPIQGLNKVARAVFRWNRPRNDSIAILQIEEFRDSPETPAASHTTRYLHSILDVEKQHFMHLDGAIKTYSQDGYSRAYDGAEEKAHKYEKLFRTDDHLTVLDEPWLACVASFFANDELVREYFGGAYE